MTFTNKKLDYATVLALLNQCENSFKPPLSQNIPYTMSDYAKKLSEFAWFILCVEGDEIIGFTAYYLNQEGGFAYIPQIWVSDNHQRKGIGAKMMDVLIKETPDFVYSIRLEVRKNNEKAVPFYKKMGFIILEDNGGKILLRKNV
jgi:ribosomal protein S18 acetylase RimI-like enzyme